MTNTMTSCFVLLAYSQVVFLPRCMECRCRLAMRILSVCPSVRRSNAWFVTKRKKDLSRFLYHTKDHLPSFLRRRMVGGGRPLLPEILGQPAPVEAKSTIFNRYSPVAPQP